MSEIRFSRGQFWRGLFAAAAVNWLVATVWLSFASGTPLMLLYAFSVGVALALVLALLAAPVVLLAHGLGARGYLSASLVGILIGLLLALALILLIGASPGEGIGSVFAIGSAMGLIGGFAGRWAMGPPAGHASDHAGQ